MIACMLVLKGLAYFQGLEFEKWLWPVLLVFPFLASVFWLMPGLLHLAFMELRYGTWKSRSIAFLLPVLIYSAFEVNLPTFLDGMERRLREDFASYPFMDYAKAVRSARVPLKQDENYWPPRETDIGQLRANFPDLLDISKLEPLFTYEENYIEQGYGNGLIGQWGIRIVDGASPVNPFPKNETNARREIAPGVWIYTVYH